MRKTCTKCRQQKDACAFAKAAGSADGLYSYCRACSRLVSKAYDDANTEARRARRREKRTAGRIKGDPLYHRVYNLRTKFGISLVGWLHLFHAQGERCAVCRGTHTGGRGWHTDHDHSRPDKHVRGILCQQCNALLGFARESTRTLDAARCYLETRR